MADETKNEPSAQTKALLERTRAAKAAAGEAAKTVTVIEDAKPTKKAKTPEPQPPVDNDHVAAGAELFAQTVATPPVQKNATQPDQPPQAPIPPFRLPENFLEGEAPVVVTNDELKRQTRTMSRTEAEQERGRQIIEKNQQARRRAEAAQRESDENERG